MGRAFFFLKIEKMLLAVIKHHYQEFLGFICGTTAGVASYVPHFDLVNYPNVFANGFIAGCGGALAGVLIKWAFNGKKKGDEKN